jgi:hypothetical protein
MFTRIAATLCAVALLLAAVPARAGQQGGPSKEDVQKAENNLKAHLAQIGAKNAQIVRIDTKPLSGTFPKDVFFAVRFRIYPVAMQIPAGLKPSNIFVVPPSGKVELLKDDKALGKFFHDHATAAVKDPEAIAVTQSWLLLAQEFVQDGFYKFEVSKEVGIVRDDVEPRRLLSTNGRAVVMAGGNGEVLAALRFGKDGKVETGTTTAKVKEGPRPICQATKLLDPDPIVREMAEQTLLYLGSAAKNYLDEQRAKASPELQRAIDRLWQRILEEER